MQMAFEPGEQVNFGLSKSACLLLFEMLTRAYGEWRKMNPEDATASPMTISAKTHAERLSFWQLEGALERTFLSYSLPTMKLS